MRVNNVTLVLGKRGSGKSYYTINKVIPQYHKSHPRQRILVVDTLDHPDYEFLSSITAEMIPLWRRGGGAYRCYDKRVDLVFSNIAGHTKNALIIFEDASKYVNKVLQKEVKEFIFDSKQKNLDLIFQFHGFASCPPELFRLCDIIVMFHTDNPLYRRAELTHYDEIQTAFDQIQASGNPYEKRIIKIA
jgi:hypothetical protein